MRPAGVCRDCRVRVFGEASGASGSESVKGEPLL